MTEREPQIKALASPVRMEILRVLDSPATHFSHQESADPVETGVCMNLIAEHFGVSQPTMSRHLDLLRRAGFIKTRKIRQWTYCQRNEAGLADHILWLSQSLGVIRPVTPD